MSPPATLSLATLALALAGCAAAVPHARTPVAPAGLATAWVAFDANSVEDSGAVGLADRRTGRAITIDDPARVASITKLVVAIGVMRLVEQGEIDLDADVSTALGWRLRNPAFPDVPITLRLLLSHRSSIVDGVDYVLPLDADLRRVLDDRAAWDQTNAPGAYFRYSNLAFPVIASVLERRMNERFDRLMDRLVIAPLGLDACFNWASCSGETAARAVVLYRGNGDVARDDNQGRAPACPVTPARDGSCDLSTYVLGRNGALFAPQGGLRISTRGLAVIGQMLINGGVHQSRRLLSEASVAQILTPAWRYDGANGDPSEGFYCAYGLASHSLPNFRAGCDDAVLGDRALVGHAGEAYGLRSGLWIDRARRRGIAFIAANNGEAQAQGRTAFTAVEEQMIARIGR